MLLQLIDSLVIRASGTVRGLPFPPDNVRHVGRREAWVAATFMRLACVVLR